MPRVYRTTLMRHVSPQPVQVCNAFVHTVRTVVVFHLKSSKKNVKNLPLHIGGHESPKGAKKTKVVEGR